MPTHAHSSDIDFIKNIFEASKVIVCCWNKKEIIYCSKAFLDFFKIDRAEEFIERRADFSPIKQLNGDKSSELRLKYHKLALKNGSCNFKWMHIVKDNYLPVEYNLNIIKHNDEELIVSTLTPVEILKQNVDADKRARDTLNAAPLSITFWNRDFQAIDCNDAALKMVNITDKEEFLDNAYDIFPEYQPDGSNSTKRAKEILADTFKQGHYYCPEWNYLNSDGEIVPAEVNLVRIAYGKEYIVVEYAKDLRELRTNKIKAAEAEKRTYAMLESLPMGVNLWNSKYEIIDCNLAAMTMLGIESKEAYKAKFFECTPEYQPNGERSVDLIPTSLQKAFDDGYTRFEWLFKTMFGEPLYTEVTIIRVKIGEEHLVAAYQRDLSEIKASQARMREAEERTQIMLDTTPLCANFWNQDFQNIDCNLAAAKLFDLRDKQEYLEKFFLLSPEFQPDGRSSAESALEKITTAFNDGVCKFEWMHQKLNGDPIPAEITLIRSDHHGEPIVVGYTKDLRELKASQAIALEAEARTQAMFEATPLCIKFWDESQNIVACNNESLRLFGFKDKQDLLENFDKTLPDTQPNGQKSLPYVLGNLAIALKDGYCNFEALYQHAITKEPIPAELTLVRIKDHDKDAIVSYLRDLREFKAMLNEINEVQEDLRTARDMAEKSTQAKSEFLANMSHEIRTPMNGILGLVHLLAQTKLGSAQENYVQKILYSANSLLRIINDILDFSKIEAGKLELEIIPFTLKEICDELYTLFSPKVADKGVSLQIKYDELAHVHILSDSLRIKQIIFNLMSNALKFTDKGSININVQCSKLNKDEIHCTFAVQDTGIGLSEEQLSRLFSAFTQADSSVTRKYGGTGLGLVISRSLAQMLGGTIEIKSALGEGSTFALECDFTIAKEKDIEQIKLHTNTESYVENDIDHHGHLLLVEDNDINQLIAEELLTSVGYTLEIAQNGQEALDLLSKNRYDLVLMDIQMPVMDGLTATLKIREIEKFVDLPVIAMSAHAMAGDKEISLAHGMNDHITKPIDPQKLYSTINHWINLKN